MGGGWVSRCICALVFVALSLFAMYLRKMSSDTVTRPLERSVCGGFSQDLSKQVHDLLVKFG